MTTLIGRCSSCRHAIAFKQLGAEGLYCRRNPPTPMLVPTDKGPLLTGVCAPVTPDFLCGEWRADAPLLSRGEFKSLRQGEAGDQTT